MGCKRICQEGIGSRERRKEGSQDNVERTERENTCENISLEGPLMLSQLSEPL